MVACSSSAVLELTGCQYAVLRSTSKGGVSVNAADHAAQTGARSLLISRDFSQGKNRRVAGSLCCDYGRSVREGRAILDGPNQLLRIGRLREMKIESRLSCFHAIVRS